MQQAATLLERACRKAAREDGFDGLILSLYDSAMSDLLIRDIPARTMSALKARAKQHRRSVQAEVLDILQSSEIPAGDALLRWLCEVRRPGIRSVPGITAIRQARDER